MRSILFESAARRWSLSIGLLAGLALMLVTLAPSIDAQRPPVPHFFWGKDATAYVGGAISAISEDGTVVGTGTVDSQGNWSIHVNQQDAPMVKFRLTFGDVVRETGFLDVIEGGFDPQGISITAFSPVIETIKVEIYARLHPTRTPRTWEFTVRVDEVPVDPAPRARFHGPSLQREAWYASSPISIAGGFEVRVVACRAEDEDMRFGLRVAGRDDIIPQRNLLSGDRTSTNWARSSLIDLPLPGNDPNPSRAPGTSAATSDADCRYGK